MTDVGGFHARVIVASTRAATGVYPDGCGPVLVDGLRRLGGTVDEPVVVADGEPVRAALRAAIDEDVDVVVTSGGTGLSGTDRTPEATAGLLDFPVPGIAEAVRAAGAAQVPTAVLSRGVAGVAGGTLIVNLAGSRGAAVDGLAVLEPILAHAVDQLRGGDHGPAADARHGAAGGARHGAGPGLGHADRGATHGADRGARAAADRVGSVAATAGRAPEPTAPAWRQARAAAHAAGTPGPEPVWLPLADVAGHTLAAPLRTLTALPAFPTASVDGYAVAGEGPWRVTGRVLAGHVAAPIVPGTAVQIATGAMVPAGAEQLIRLEDSDVGPDGTVTGTPRRSSPEWRGIGEEAPADEELLPAGTAITPGVLGIAAQCGHDQLLVRRPPRASVLVFGDELATAGAPGGGRVRDSLGPQLPGWLARIGASPVGGPAEPVADTLSAHVDAIRSAAAGAELICTTGGTMRGPVDHLHAALTELGAEYIVDTVAVRPGYPMLLARLPGGRFLAGLPGNPQSAVLGLLSLVWPLVAGLTGRALPRLPRVRLGAAIPGRGAYTHLALVRLDVDGVAHPVRHAGSAMLRGLAAAHGFVVIEPDTDGVAGAAVPMLPLPLHVGELL